MPSRSFRAIAACFADFALPQKTFQATYVTGYLTLVMLSVTSLLLIQGGIATLAGIIAFSSICTIITAILLHRKVKRARAE
jgi:hypothetical protein